MALLARWFWRVLYFPLTRIIIAVAAILAGVVLGSVALEKIGHAYGLTTRSWFVAVAGAIVIFSVCLIYCGYVRLLEKRRTLELGPEHAPREFAIGTAIGLCLFAATVVCLWVGGYYRVEGFGQWPTASEVFALGLVPAFLEEILIRGVIFRITEESLGTWLAILISALLFGLVHLLNPGANLIAALCVVLEAGVLLAAAFITTRRLWFPIGLHFAWNFTQGGIFGLPVSGRQVGGLLRSALTGPELITGGAFGAEASIFAVFVCASMAIYLLIRASRKGCIIRPFWSRRFESSLVVQ
jgi:membrane protease YdiL (CAAX protease family)